jgi:hypothetical protein
MRPAGDRKHPFHVGFFGKLHFVSYFINYVVKVIAFTTSVDCVMRIAMDIVLI